MEADRRFAMVPANMARIPNLASWLRCSGASAPMPPIWMPMELKFANPQSAKVAMVKDLGSRESFRVPSCAKATNSLSTIRVPSKLPMVGASCQGIPCLRGADGHVRGHHSSGDVGHAAGHHSHQFGFG